MTKVGVVFTPHDLLDRGYVGCRDELPLLDRACGHRGDHAAHFIVQPDLGRLVAHPEHDLRAIELEVRRQKPRRLPPLDLGTHPELPGLLEHRAAQLRIEVVSHRTTVAVLRDTARPTLNTAARCGARLFRGPSA